MFPCPQNWANLFDSLISNKMEEEAELIEDGVIIEETLAGSNYDQGVTLVNNKNAHRNKRSRVVSQQQLQKDLQKRKKIGDIAEKKYMNMYKKGN